MKSVCHKIEVHKIVFKHFMNILYNLHMSQNVVVQIIHIIQAQMYHCAFKCLLTCLEQVHILCMTEFEVYTHLFSKC